jgi:hypothetical protein
LATGETPLRQLRDDWETVTRCHRVPDAVEAIAGDGLIAYEVELSSKGKARRQKIIESYEFSGFQAVPWIVPEERLRKLIRRETLVVRSGKGGRPRRQPIAPVLARELEELRATRSPRSDAPVFRGLRGRRLKPTILAGVISRAAKRPGSTSTSFRWCGEGRCRRATERWPGARAERFHRDRRRSPFLKRNVTSP